jgi:16S rRNA G1207 methylase RsmC
VFDYKNNQIWINCAINKFKLVDNYATINFIKDNIGMKFDVVVGNPPFKGKAELRQRFLIKQ